MELVYQTNMKNSTKQMTLQKEDTLLYLRFHFTYQAESTYLSILILSLFFSLECLFF